MDISPILEGIGKQIESNPLVAIILGAIVTVGAIVWLIGKEPDAESGDDNRNELLIELLIAERQGNDVRRLQRELKEKEQRITELEAQLQTDEPQ